MNNFRLHEINVQNWDKVFDELVYACLIGLLDEAKFIVKYVEFMLKYLDVFK
jgi:hypothetical protein